MVICLSGAYYAMKCILYTLTDCRIVVCVPLHYIPFITPHFTSTYEEKLLEALPPVTD